MLRIKAVFFDFDDTLVSKKDHTMKENTKKATVFLVSQRAATVKNADQILVLDDGKLVGKGTHEELLKNCNVYKEICMSQFSSQEVAQL